MVNSITTSEAKSIFSGDLGRLFLALSGIFLFVAGLAIFQDFLESKRSGYAFYFNESLLFKMIWFLFIPILTLLYKRLSNETLNSYGKTAIYIITPIVIHLVILPFVAVVFSMLFYDGRYDLYKFFSYTLARDFYNLVIVYACFVLGYRYWSLRTRSFANQRRGTLETIVINNGKSNVVVNTCDILQITSATPYIFIHLESKKYLHSETLKSISAQLDNSVFVRVHKSAVINISKVSSFKSRLNGDYDLGLSNGDLVRLSRTYAAGFKKHFNARSSGQPVNSST